MRTNKLIENVFLVLMLSGEHIIVPIHWHLGHLKKTWLSDLWLLMFERAHVWMSYSNVIKKIKKTYSNVGLFFSNIGKIVWCRWQCLNARPMLSRCRSMNISNQTLAANLGMGVADELVWLYAPCYQICLRRFQNYKHPPRGNWLNRSSWLSGWDRESDFVVYWFLETFIHSCRAHH